MRPSSLPEATAQSPGPTKATSFIVCLLMWPRYRMTYPCTPHVHPSSARLCCTLALVLSFSPTVAASRNRIPEHSLPISIQRKCALPRVDNGHILCCLPSPCRCYELRISARLWALQCCRSDSVTCHQQSIRGPVGANLLCEAASLFFLFLSLQHDSEAAHMRFILSHLEDVRP